MIYPSIRPLTHRAHSRTSARSRTRSPLPRIIPPLSPSSTHAHTHTHARTPAHCSPAGTYGDTDDDKCIGCPAGKHSAAPGAAACSACEPGKYSGDAATRCSNCSAGTYSAAEATTCTDCSVGYYMGEPGATACLACGAGTFAVSEASTNCTTCSAGYFASSTGSSACAACASGFYSEAGSASCTKCSSGEFSNRTASACDSCPVGRTSATGASTCEPCELGTYASTAGSESCTSCGAGKFQNVTGAMTCRECQPGRSQPDARGSKCDHCDAGKYMADSGATACLACSSEEGRGKTSAEGAATCDACLMSYYRDGEACVRCDDGMVCDDEGATLEELPVRDGYYRFLATSPYVYECELWKYEKNCHSSTIVVDGSAASEASNATAQSRLRRRRRRRRRRLSDAEADANSTWGDALCTEYASGALCGVCVEGSYFDSDDQACAPCDGYQLTTQTIVGIAILAAIVLLLFALKVRTNSLADRISFYGSGKRLDLDDDHAAGAEEDRRPGARPKMKRAASARMERAANRMERAHKEVKSKLKIMVTFSQLISGFGFVLDVRFPDPYSSVAAAFGNLNLNFFQLAPIECTYPESNFFTDLAFSTTWPILVAVVLLSLHLRNRRTTQSYFSLFLILTYLVLPVTSSKIFSAFKCDEFIVDDETSLYFVSVDYSIECASDDPWYPALLVLAVAMAVVYVVGVQALYALLLYRAQEDLSIVPRVELSKLFRSSRTHRGEAKKQLGEFCFGDVARGRAKPAGGGSDKEQEEEWEALSEKHELSVLIGSYERRTYWFECIEVWRRMLLSGCLVLFGPGSVVQGVVSVLICLASIEVHCHFIS